MSGAVPQLRFPGFAGKWLPKSIGDIVRFSKGKGISKADIVVGGSTPCIRYGELYTTYGTVIDDVISFTEVDSENLRMSTGGEVIIPASGESAEDIATAAVVVRPGVALGSDLNIMTTNENGHFLALYISSRKRMELASLAQGNSVVHLYPAQISSLTAAIPSIQEQQKIADFLGTVDAKHEALRRKKSGLEAFKSGLMQRLFSQTVRFTRDDGTDFPDWEEMRLDEVFVEVRTPVGNRDIPTYSISAGRGFVSQEERFGKDISGQQNEKYIALAVGEFSYNKGNSISYNYGCIYENRTGKTIAVPNVFISFKLRSMRMAPVYFGKLFESHYLDRGLRTLISSGARMNGLLNVNKAAFFALTIPVPHPDEQRKIADALSALDAKVAAVADQITHMETFKKGLLQQMFV